MNCDLLCESVVGYELMHGYGFINGFRAAAEGTNGHALTILADSCEEMFPYKGISKVPVIHHDMLPLWNPRCYVHASVMPFFF